MAQKQTAQDKLERFDRIQAAIAALEQQKKLIFATGEVTVPIPDSIREKTSI